MTQAIVLFAHGARDPRWAEPFEAVAAQVRAGAPGSRGRPRLSRADDADARATRSIALAAAGATRIDVVPLFLGTGGHLRQRSAARSSRPRAPPIRHWRSACTRRSASTPP